MQDIQNVYPYFDAYTQLKMGIPPYGQDKGTAAKYIDYIRPTSERTVALYLVGGGEDVSTACRNMTMTAREWNCDVVMAFNDVIVHVCPSDNVTDVVARWRVDTDAAAEAYRNSPAGKAAQARFEAMMAAEAQQVQDALARLPNTDLTDARKALHIMADVADKRIPPDGRQALLDAYTTAGYVANDCTGRDFVETNPENFARYIIGQALAGISTVGTPHGMTQVFRERWDKAFRRMTHPIRLTPYGYKPLP